MSGFRISACDIEIEALSYVYPGGGASAIHDISLAIRPGEHVAIVGPNGAGKTTLLLHLNGTLRPTTGSIRIDGRTLTSDNLPEIRRRVGLVFQDPDDQLFMPTVLEDVAFGPLCEGLSREEAETRARRALGLVGLDGVDPTRPAHHLSGGEKRRAALATVLAQEPGVLALDEPSSGLDARGRRRIAGFLREQPETLVLVTHDVEFAAAVCARMVVIDDGRLTADAPSTELLSHTELLREHGLDTPGSLIAGLSDPGPELYRGTTRL